MKFSNETMYTCLVRCSMQLILQRDNRISTFVGEHLNRKYSHLDVRAIWFSDFVMNFVPTGLSEIFPNVEAIGIVGCELLEISREDLKEFTNLKYIYLHYNKFTSLPVDLFEGKRKLQEISIIGNKELRSGISRQLFQPVINNGLKYVDLSGNGCFDAFYCPRYKGSLESIQQLMMAIDNNEAKTDNELNGSEAEDVTDNVDESQEFVPYENGADTSLNDDPAGFGTFQNSLEEPILIELSSDTVNLSSTEELLESSIELEDGTEIEDPVTIYVEDRNFLVNKEKLLKQSPKIAQLIKELKTCQLRILDISPETVQSFVDFINKGKVPNKTQGISLISNLYSLAAEWKVIDLEIECEEIILENITTDNIIEVLRLGSRFRSLSMRRQAIEKAIEFYPAMIPEILKYPNVLDENFTELINLVQLYKEKV